MKSKWLFILHEHGKQLWFRSSLYCLLGVVTALLGVAFDDAVPKPLKDLIDPQAVEQILAIMASSMLVVATFALSIMVQAFRTVTTTATPRATKLLTENTRAQNALAAFIGAFLFSVVGLIALSAGIYGVGGAVVLFGSTVVVVILVVMMLLRWVEQLSRLGRVGDSIDQVEEATRQALVKRARKPFLGGRPLKEMPDRRFPVSCELIGYVQYIDMEALQNIAKRHDLMIYINILPGSFCDLVRHVAYTDKAVDANLSANISQALVIGDGRTFEQDPRFGLIVLNEIAIRALSPAMNDPGTAIDVIGTSVRLFRDWARERRSQPEHAPVHYDRVWVTGLREEDFFDDMFSPIVRDGAGYREACVRLQKALRAIAQLGYQPYEKPARAMAERLLNRSKGQLAEEEFSDVKALLETWR